MRGIRHGRNRAHLRGVIRRAEQCDEVKDRNMAAMFAEARRVVLRYVWRCGGFALAREIHLPGPVVVRFNIWSTARAALLAGVLSNRDPGYYILVRGPDSRVVAVRRDRRP